MRWLAFIWLALVADIALGQAHVNIKNKTYSMIFNSANETNLNV